MRKFIAIASMLVLAAVSAQAFDIALYSGSATCTDSTNGTLNKIITLPNMRGTLGDVQVDFPTAAGVTGKVAISITQANGETVSIYTNDVMTADVTVRPSVFLNIGAAGGTAPTNYAPVKYTLFGDTMTITITNVGVRVTNLTYTVNVKVER
jgi:hypothetical protein